MRIILKELAVPILAFVKQIFRSPALGHVSGYLGESTKVSILVSDRGEDDARPKFAPVFPYAPSLFFIASLGSGYQQLSFRFSRLDIFGRIKAGEVTPQNFAGFVTFDPLGPRVPACNVSRGI
ncbi:MAG TPA: hypothetical protein VFB43_06850 [Terracidiphilus sp.]|nr:hypothetical protein [Terracidiphilus sp.]